MRFASFFAISYLIFQANVVFGLDPNEFWYENGRVTDIRCTSKALFDENGKYLGCHVTYPKNRIVVWDSLGISEAGCKAMCP